MITDHTEPVEAWAQLAEDVVKIQYFIQKYKKKAIANAQNARSYPFFETVDYTPPATNNTHKVYFETRLKDDGRLSTKSGSFLPVEQKNGRRIYFYIPEKTNEMKDAYLWVVNPHFMSRYRQRTGFPGVDNVTELLCDVLDNFPELAMSFENHKGVNRNYFKYNSKVDGEACNRYIPMKNGVAFINEQAYENKKSQLPRFIYVIEVRTFVNLQSLSRRQYSNILKDIRKAVGDDFAQDGAAKNVDVPDAFKDADPPVEKEKKTTRTLSEPAKDVFEPVATVGGINEREHRDRQRRLSEMGEFARSLMEEKGLVLEDAIDEDSFVPGDYEVPQLDRGLRRFLSQKMDKHVQKKLKNAAKNGLLQDVDPDDDIDEGTMESVEEFEKTAIETVVDMRADGCSPDGIARSLEISRDRVRAIIRDNKDRIEALKAERTAAREKEKSLTSKNKNMAREHFNDRQVQEMVLMYNDGKSVGEISRSFNTTPSSIRKTIEPHIHGPKAGDQPEAIVEVPKKTVLTERQVTDILGQVTDGVEYSAIATRFSITIKDVNDVVSAHAERLAVLTSEKASKEAVVNADKEEAPAKKNGKTTRSYTKITDKLKEDIIHLYSEGISISDIVDLTKVSSFSIYKALKSKGVKTDRFSQESYSESEIERILALVDQNKTRKEIAEEIGRSYNSLRSFMFRNGICTKMSEQSPEDTLDTDPARENVTTAPETVEEQPRPSNKEAQKGVIISLNEKGFSPSRISKVTGVNISDIKEILSKENLYVVPAAKAESAAEPAPEPQTETSAPQKEPAPEATPAWGEADLLQMVKLHKDGVTLDEISVQYGISRNVLDILMPARTSVSVLPVRPEPRQRTLDDFAPRDIIRFLYTKGFRLAGDDITMVHEVEVRDNDEEVVRLRSLGYNIDIKGLTRTVTDKLNLDDVLSGLRN